MADKLVPGDSLNEEVFNKFNGMVDEVNELKESGGGSGGAVVELSGESGTLTDEQYLQCTNPTTVIKWFNGSGAHSVYEYWRFISPTYYFKSVYIDADECINNIIEIDQISHGWKRKSTEYSGGSTVSVTQTLTSGTKIGAITVDGKTTALYAPEGGGSGGGGGGVPADAIIDVDKLPEEENAYLFKNGAKVEEYLMRKVVVYIVDTLPDVGELFLTSTSCNIYYQKGDDEAYCYLTPDVPPGGNFTGWAGLSSGFGWVSDFGYGGVITDESQATDTSRKYFVYHEAEYINTQAIYRAPSVYDSEFGFFASGVYIPNGGRIPIEGTTLLMPLNIIVVDILPEVGTVLQSAAGVTAYVSIADGGVFGYDENYGWLNLVDAGVLAGVIFSPQDAADPEGSYLLITPKFKLYHYINGWHEIGGSSSGTGASKSFIFDRTVVGEEETSEDIGDYRYVTLSGENKTTCMELHNYVKENYHKIISIEYRNRVPVFSVITQASCITRLNVSEGENNPEENSQIVVSDNLGTIEDFMNVRFGLRNDGVLIYPKNDNAWGFVFLMMFDITVTTA